MLAILNQILEFILPAQTSFLTWAGSRPIKLSSFVPLSLLKLSILNQSICFWSFDLETIIPLHVSFELVSCFYNPMPSHCFFLWLCADTHISFTMDRRIHCWNIIRQCPPYTKPREVISLIHNAIGKSYSLIWPTMLCFRAGDIYSWSLWYMFLRYPDGLNLMPSLICVNSKVFMSHTLLVFC